MDRNCLLMVTSCVILLTQAACAQRPLMKGDRLLGIGINEGSIGFDAAFPVAKAAGMQFVELPQQWDEIEPKPGQFTSPFLDIANAYYPTVGIRLVISLNPIDTNSLRLPKDLQGKAFDDPQVIDRFNKAIDFVLQRLPKTTLVAFSIGNEIDGYLGSDRNKWAQYERFFKATSAHFRKMKPGVPVGTKAMMPSVIGGLKNEIQSINRHADAAFVTYYPLGDGFRVKPPTVVHQDIASLATLYAGRPIYLLESGYPSSSFLGSSEEKQSQFVSEMFTAWDKHAKQIAAMNFIWLHDISRDEVNGYTKYYGLNSRGFGEYLGTLGLRSHDGKDKQAFKTLSREAKKRGW